MKQLSAHLKEIESRMCDILAVVPLPKGPPSKVKGSSRCHSHKYCWETPSSPPKCHRVLRVTESLSSNKGPQQVEPSRPVGSVPVTSPSQMVSVPLSFAAPSLLVGSLVVCAVAHLLTSAESLLVEEGAPQVCWGFGRVGLLSLPCLRDTVRREGSVTHGLFPPAGPQWLQGP